MLWSGFQMAKPSNFWTCKQMFQPFYYWPLKVSGVQMSGIQIPTAHTWWDWYLQMEAIVGRWRTSGVFFNHQFHFRFFSFRVQIRILDNWTCVFQCFWVFILKKNLICISYVYITARMGIAVLVFKNTKSIFKFNFKPFSLSKN